MVSACNVVMLHRNCLSHKNCVCYTGIVFILQKLCLCFTGTVFMSQRKCVNVMKELCVRSHIGTVFVTQELCIFI